jgi:hypothetical protein
MWHWTSQNLIDLHGLLQEVTPFLTLRRTSLRVLTVQSQHPLLGRGGGRVVEALPYKNRSQEWRKLTTERLLLSTSLPATFVILIIRLCILLRVYQSIYIETSVRNKCRCSFYCTLFTLHVSAPIGGLHLQDGSVNQAINEHEGGSEECHGGKEGQDLYCACWLLHYSVLLGLVFDLKMEAI